MTPAAIRKRDQRARTAAGQVHRVTVWLTDGEFEGAKVIGMGNAERGLRTCARHYAPLDTAPQTAHNPAP